MNIVSWLCFGDLNTIFCERRFSTNGIVFDNYKVMSIFLGIKRICSLEWIGLFAIILRLLSVNYITIIFYNWPPISQILSESYLYNLKEGAITAKFYKKVDNSG